MRRPSFKLLSSTTLIFLAQAVPLVLCFSYEHEDHQHGHRLRKNSSQAQLSPEMISHVTVHGILLWISMGFLMPVGILTIRVSGREQRDSTTARVFFYLHVILQMLSVLLATVGAVMSIRNLENLFNNNHQRLGLVLYPAIWIQVLIGFFRPQRGKEGRKMWYVVHWMLGTLVSLVGILNIYTGLEAYQKRTLKSTRLWTILFSTELALVAFLYLYQDKREYMIKQEVMIQGNLQPESGTTTTMALQLVPQPCGKQNALRNLFD